MCVRVCVLDLYVCVVLVWFLWCAWVWFMYNEGCVVCVCVFVHVQCMWCVV